MERAERIVAGDGELHFDRDNGIVDGLITRLIGHAGEVHHPDLLRQMILAALKAGRENGGRADLKQMNTALKELRFTSKTFKPYRNVRKVSVFGSARENPDGPLYRMARRLGKQVAEAGCMVITGGGPGIMQAANEGAGPENSFGVNIRLPMEQRPNPVVEGSPRHIRYKYFFTRKVAFLKEADAVVLFPGGYGTLDEAMETLTLVQTGKCHPMPVVLIDVPGGSYWSSFIAFLRSEVVGRGRAGEADLSFFEPVHAVEDAVDHIRRFYRNYHSMRYVGDRLVIRLNQKVAPRQLEALARDFGDILTRPDGIRMTGPLLDERDSPEISHLPRMVLDFNRRDHGRLRCLIDAVNRL